MNQARLDRHGKGARVARWGLRGLAACALLATLPVQANDFPTIERVMFVHECALEHTDRPPQEMLYKCSCALDRIAEKVKFEDWSTMNTLAKAQTIAGERGGTLRENDSIKPAIKIYREIRAAADNACFIAPPPKK